MKVEIIKDACIGCGACPAICPDIFEIGDDGYAFVKNINVPDNLKDDAEDAANGCPTAAIVTK